VNVRHSITPKGEKRTDRDLIRSCVNRQYCRPAMGCEMLERSAVKVARSVFRRGHRSNSMSLFYNFGTWKTAYTPYKR
jgi:hypothetical protein